MSISIAQSRQHLSALIDAAQAEPQVITKRNKAVAVLVSADYFERSASVAGIGEGNYFQQLMKLRAEHPPQDDGGFFVARGEPAPSWDRANPFSGTD